MVYEITNLDDGEAKYVEYINNRDFNVEYDENERPPEIAGDVGPEQLRFVNEDIYGKPLLIVANAESSSVTIYRIDCEEVILDKKGRPLEIWEITLIIIGSILFGIIYLFVMLWLIKRNHTYDKSGNTKSTLNLTQQSGGSSDNKNKTYSRINTDDNDQNET